MKKPNVVWLGRLIAFLGAFVLWASVAVAQQATPDEIPPELQPWIPWVRAELGPELCASVEDERTCQWPGLLRLELEEQGGSFQLFVDVDARGRRSIVGGQGAWPQDVHVDGRAAPVLSVGDSPVVHLTPGRHEISGEFSWSRLPETLEIGVDTAFVELRAFGKEVPLVKREGSKIWLKGLGETAESEGQSDHVELLVFRQIRDGLPLLVETRLVLQVAGRARQLTLPAPLLPNTLPLSVSADLALALDPTGDLRVQLLPGRHELTLLARHTKPNAVIENRARPSPWPPLETWTFVPAPDIRAVDLSGLQGIDASRTELPEQWRKDGAYVAPADAKLTIKTTRRGQEQVPDNRLQFSREFWLDEKANTFTVRDHISGDMHQGFRLDLLSGTLGSVEVEGRSQVITKHQDKSGVEVRVASLDMTAVSRVERTPKLTAVSWSEDAQSLSALLHLPPGWDVLFVSGVDNTSRTWLSRWDLFDVFYLLIVGLGMWRLAGPVGGLVAAGALFLSRGESGAPEYLWLPLLGLIALFRVIAPGRFRTWLSAMFSVLGLITVVMLVAFSVDQVRQALYPHLDRYSSGGEDFGALTDGEAPAAPAAVELDAAPPPASPEMEGTEEMAPLEDAEESKSGAAPLRKKTFALRGANQAASSASRLLSSGSYGNRSSVQQQFQPDAVAQTGPGVPEAAGEPIRLSWSGPVVREHQISLHLISPGVSRLLTVLRLSALWSLAYLLFRLLRSAPTTPKHSPGPQGPSRAAKVAAGVVVAAFSLCHGPSDARAEPSDARLSELKERLTRAAECEPNCLSVASMQIELEESLHVEAEVHVGAVAAYKLPGPAKNLVEGRVLVDGKQATALRLSENGAYYLRLSPGVHRVELDARLPRDRVTLDVGTPPEWITAQTRGWSVSGINEQGRAVGGTLIFQRAAPFSEGVQPLGGQQSKSDQSVVAVPAFFHVERHLSLGVTASVVTRVRRLSEASSPEVLRLPLLAGERLTTSGIEVNQGVAEVSFSREETEKQLVSTLVLPDDESAVELSLTAPGVQERSETWLLECGVVYHCKTEGLVPSSLQKGGQVLSTFHPFPGETLRILATEPRPAEGSSITVLKATATFTPGVRTGSGRLELALKTSRSVVHAVTIPVQAKLEEVTVNGTAQAVKSENGKVRISLQPGVSRVVVSWQERHGLVSWFTSPKIDAGALGVNFRTVVNLPADRWLLIAGGPPQGPALLFWGYLVLIVIAAFLLPRAPHSPLLFHQWLLLGLGLTQVPAAVAVFVAGWFFAVAGRRHFPVLGRYRRNLIQLLLVFYTLAFLSSLTGAVYEGLISSPDMEVRGAGSYNDHLVWYQDRSAGPFAEAWVLSVNLWVWRAFMLAWALWLSRSLLSWLRWAWQELNEGGFWAPRPPRPNRIPQPTTGVSPMSTQSSAAETKHKQDELGPDDPSTDETSAEEAGADEPGGGEPSQQESDPSSQEESGKTRK